MTNPIANDEQIAPTYSAHVAETLEIDLNHRLTQAPFSVVLSHVRPMSLVLRQ